MRWFGAERVLDPPAVQNRNQHQREHAFLYSARLREAVSLATGRFLGARARAQVQHAASIFFGVAAALPRASRRPISGASALFFALNTALRNKALRARSFFVKRQFGLNANVACSNKGPFRRAKPASLRLFLPSSTPWQALLKKNATAQ